MTLAVGAETMELFTLRRPNSPFGPEQPMQVLTDLGGFVYHMR